LSGREPNIGALADATAAGPRHEFAGVSGQSEAPPEKRGRREDPVLGATAPLPDFTKRSVNSQAKQTTVRYNQREDLMRRAADQLLDQLAGVFRCSGYEGASLARLAEVSRLQKASLYHRFPRGKAQMAEAVLAEAGRWLERDVVAVLDGEGPPAERLQTMIANVRRFYEEGARGCLLESLSLGTPEGPIAESVREALAVWIDALARCLKSAKLPAAEARRSAEDFVVRIQGALVVSRGLADRGPFRRTVKRLEEELLRSIR
jgi:AcrR family transcriptional regulator